MKISFLKIILITSSLFLLSISSLPASAFFTDTKTGSVQVSISIDNTEEMELLDDFATPSEASRKDPVKVSKPDRTEDKVASDSNANSKNLNANLPASQEA